jgi:cytochrome c5
MRCCNLFQAFSLIAFSALLFADASGPFSEAPFSKAQSDRGAGVYRDKCSACHGAQLNGGDHAPPLRDEAFWQEWDGKAARALYSRIITTMPPDDAGSLAEKEVIDLIAYLVASRGVPAGPKSIEHADQLNSIKLEQPRQAGR